MRIGTAFTSSVTGQSSSQSRDGQLFAAKNDGGSWTMEDVNVTNMDFSSYVLSFGQDNAGDVYVTATDTTGPNGGLDKIYKIAPAE